MNYRNIFYKLAFDLSDCTPKIQSTKEKGYNNDYKFITPGNNSYSWRVIQK